MVKTRSISSKERVVLAARQFGISSVLFRNIVAGRLGLNVTDMECLALLFHKGLSSPSELAEHTGLTSGAATAMLDRLEHSGLIERKPNPHDRRGTIIELAKSGTDRVAPCFAAVRKAQDVLITGYSDKELNLLSEFLEKFARIWEQERRKLQQAENM